MRSALFVWAALVALTLLSFELQRQARVGSGLVGLAVLLIAFYKVRLIGMRYMELRDAPLALRLAFDGWVIGFASVLLVLFRLGDATSLN